MDKIFQSLQKWTPLSVIILIISAMCIFIIVYDTIYHLAIPAFVIALLSLLTGGTGATSLVTHGANVVNGTLDKVVQIAQPPKEDKTA